MGFVCANAPDGLRVVMTSRTDPPIGLSRLRARGDLAEIRAPDLRFSDDEARALLAEAGLSLRDDEVARLRQRTEGWAAGLYLAGLSLRGREDAARFIADFAGDDRLVVDYLADEVLEGLPAERREFLLRTSVLGRLSGPLCDAVAGTSGSARVLAELERSNLFLVPLDNRREWYRYHHLFGELLQHELALTAPDEVAELHRRAAAWHLAEGSVDDAVRHAVGAGDLAQAADLIAEHWSDHLRRGWTVTTQNWLELLPAETVLADVRLCLAEAWLAINLGLPEEAERWLDAAEACEGAWGDPQLEASRIAARSLARLLAGDAPEALRFGLEALAGDRGRRDLVARGRLPGRRHRPARLRADGGVVPHPRGVRRGRPAHRRLGAGARRPLPPGLPGRRARRPRVGRAPRPRGAGLRGRGEPRRVPARGGRALRARAGARARAGCWTRPRPTPTAAPSWRGAAGRPPRSPTA